MNAYMKEWMNTSEMYLLLLIFNVPSDLEEHLVYSFIVSYVWISVPGDGGQWYTKTCCSTASLWTVVLNL